MKLSRIDRAILVGLTFCAIFLVGIIGEGAPRTVVIACVVAFAVLLIGVAFAVLPKR